ncbi:MAG: peptide antibiotic transporter SbmA [Cellvibrionaceae bacterium]|nr:peptide antibiotic transporter SbmA [Cellvibrionaceae bacterium]
MFKSFFPNPKLFFISFVVWAGISVAVWYEFKLDMGTFFGLNLEASEPVIGLGFFVTDAFLLFYGYYLVSVALFAGVWFQLAPHKWQWWSVVVSAVILFSTYFSVQASVALNHWRRPFGDMLQAALTGDKTVTPAQFYELLLLFAEIAFLLVSLYVVTRFVVSHYIFRWRTAMNDYYTGQWKNVRHIEGASQRVQEDTMRFATIMEDLGVSIVDAIMTLFAFLPLLWSLSQYVQTLPIVGEIPYPLFFAALFWAIFGTALLALVGVKLPGLQFRNQRVEAAYRKELVYGEDNHDRAQPVTLDELFVRVRRNYFRLYFHYAYFNIARSLYLQADNIFVVIILVPTIFTGAITYGIFSQITTAFAQVGSSFQYLVNSWTTIIELLSVRKRLVSFEAAIRDEPLPEIDRNYQA